MWTGVVLGSYLALSLASGGFLSEIPTNTVVVIGISSGTLAFSSLIRGVQNGGNGAGARDSTNAFMGGFLAYDGDPTKPSLVKAQMFAWNLVAVLLFVTFVGSNIYGGNYSLPDIGGTVSAIIGISNGAHVAVKPVDK